MPDEPTHYAPYAGVALFPRTHTDLTSTAQCPACFHALASIVCGYCGLDLAHPVAAELADVSNDVAARLDERTELIGRIRFDTARERVLLAESARRVELEREAAREENIATPGGPVLPVPLAWTRQHDAPTPATAPPAATPPVAATPAAAAPAENRRPTVQIALLIVGISLLSIAAVFFLVYAFINYGIVWRSVIIGSITIAAFVTATVLRRRSLTGTAEGIGAFAVVLLYLDAFAVRANDLFGAASSDGLVYWGTTLVTSAFLLVGWHRLSHLRVGSVAAFTLFAPGVGLLAAGLTGAFDTPTRVFAAFLAVALAGLVHPFASEGATDDTPAPSPSAERTTALAFAGLGTAIAFVTAFAVAPGNDAGISVALALVALAALAHVVVLVRSPGRSTTVASAAAGFSALGAVAASLACAILVYRAWEFEVAVGASLVATTLVALAAVLLANRALPAQQVRAARAAAIAASAVAAVALVVPAGVALYTALPAPILATTEWFWMLEPSDRIVRAEPAALGAVVGLAATVAIIAVFLSATRLYPRLRLPLGWGAVTLLLLAVPLLSVLWAVLTGWFVLAVAAVVAARWGRVARLPFARRLPVLYLAALATVLGFCTAWASTGTWAVGSGLTIALLVAARWLRAPSPVAVRAALLALAAVVALVATAAAGRQFGTPGDGVFTQVRLVSALAVAFVALAAVSSARLFSTVDRHTLFAIGAPVALVTVPLGVWGSAAGVAENPLAAPGVTLALGIALLASLAAWILPGATRALQPERLITLVAVAPSLAFTLFALAGLVGLDTDALTLVAPASALLAAAGFLAVVTRGDGAARGPGDLGVALVAVPGLVVPVAMDSRYAWLVLLLSAAIALLLAVGSDGLVRSASRRKHLGWLALALATWSLWWSLRVAAVTAVEPYVLPLAGALLLVALLVWRGGGARIAPVLVFAALAVAVLPVAVAAGADFATDEPARGIVVAAASAALLLVGSLMGSSAALRPYLDASAAAGFAGLVVVVGGRAVVGWVSGSARDSAELDMWVAAAVIVLVVAGFGQSSKRLGDRDETAPIGRALVVSGLVLGAVVETSVIAPGDLGGVRAVVTVAVFSAIYLLCFVVDKLPLERSTGWVAIGGAGLAAVAAIAKDAVDSTEAVSAPIAVVLVVVGALALARNPALRSWAVLAIPLAVVFLPSLFATAVDRPIWRLVAIGVVAVAAIVVGALRRLQAPFVVGVVVALVHGVATFAPQLRSVYQVTEWWVWLGIGGVIVTVLSIRYEKSVRAAKNVVVSIGSLR